MTRTDCFSATLLRAVVSLAIVALSGSALAATLEVKVSDAGGKPVSGAAVTLLPSNRQATSGEDGMARFDNVPPGAYDVAARAPGLAPSRTDVTVSEGNPVSVAMTLST